MSPWKCVTSMIVLRALEQVVLKTRDENKTTAQSWLTPAHSPTNLTDTTDSASLSHWLSGRTYCGFIHLSNCSVRIADIEKERGLIHFRLPPLVVQPWPVLTVCDHGQGTAKSVFTRRPQSWLCIVPTHSVFTAPPCTILGTTQVRVVWIPVKRVKG